MSEPAGALHSFAFRHSTGGLTSQDWTKYVFKNGVLQPQINIEVQAMPATLDNSIYIATWTDDGTDRTAWSVVVRRAGSMNYFGQDYYCETDVVRKTLAYLKSRLDAIDAMLRQFQGVFDTLKTEISKFAASIRSMGGEVTSLKDLINRQRRP
jgi:hypothetical protein